MLKSIRNFFAVTRRVLLGRTACCDASIFYADEVYGPGEGWYCVGCNKEVDWNGTPIG